VARDEEIVKRLQSILHATDWFTDPQVRVAVGCSFWRCLWAPPCRQQQAPGRSFDYGFGRNCCKM